MNDQGEQTMNPTGAIRPTPEDQLWTVPDVAKFLQMSVSWVKKAAADGRLPRAKGLGYALRFVPEEIRSITSGKLTLLTRR